MFTHPCLAEYDVGLGRRIHKDVRSVDDEQDVLLATDRHLRDAVHRLQTWTPNHDGDSNKNNRSRDHRLETKADGRRQGLYVRIIISH